MKADIRPFDLIKLCKKNKKNKNQSEVFKPAFVFVQFLPNLSNNCECRDYYVYVSEVLLQKVNSYHALFILPLEQSAAVTAAPSDNRDKNTLQNSSGWAALWPFL